MRDAMRWAGAAGLAALLAACGGDAGEGAAAGDSAATKQGDTVTAQATPATQPVGTAPGDSANTAVAGMAGTSVTLNPVEGSGLTGDAMAMDHGGSTMVTVTLRGATAGARHAAHVHTGRCATGGPVAAPLDPVNVADNGSASQNSTVSLTMAQLLDGRHFVQVHEANGDPGKPAACGDLPSGAG